jgi:hypothetical protein
VKLQERDKKAPGGFKELTLQLLTCRFNNSNQEGVALLKMNNLGHQLRHLTFQRRHLLHQAKRFTSLIHGSFRLVLQQGQSTFKISNP